MKRKHVNLLLALLLLGLAAALYFGSQEQEPPAPLTALAPAEIERVRIEHADAPAIVLEKEGGEWRLSEPVQARSDGFEVNSLLALAEADTHKRFAAAEVDPASLGLSPPKYTVILNDTPIAFGDTEPLQHQRYVQIGEEIALIDDLGSAAFDEDFSDLVAKTVLPQGAELVRLELPGLTLLRENGGWRSEPPDDGASAERIEATVEAWQRARAMWNAAETEEAPQGEPVRLLTEDGETVDLVVIAREPQLIVSRPDYGVRYHLSKDLAGELLQLPPADEAPQSDPPA